MLTPTTTSMVPEKTGRETTPRMRSAKASIECSLTFGTKTTNSSPPKRPMDWPMRKASFMRSERTTSTKSPKSVPIGIIYLLEAIEINKQDTDPGARILRYYEGVIEAVHERAAVGKPGELVLLCSARQVTLDPPPLGRVTGVDEHTSHAFVVQEVGRMKVNMPFDRGLGMNEPYRYWSYVSIRRRIEHDAVKGFGYRCTIVVMHEVPYRATFEIINRHTEGPRRRVADVANPLLLVDYCYDVGAVVDHGSKECVTLLDLSGLRHDFSGQVIHPLHHRRAQLAYQRAGGDNEARGPGCDSHIFTTGQAERDDVRRYGERQQSNVGPARVRQTGPHRDEYKGDEVEVRPGLIVAQYYPRTHEGVGERHEHQSCPRVQARPRDKPDNRTRCDG